MINNDHGAGAHSMLFISISFLVNNLVRTNGFKFGHGLIVPGILQCAPLTLEAFFVDDGSKLSVQIIIFPGAAGDVVAEHDQSLK
jgi:hypothetical protein